MKIFFFFVSADRERICPDDFGADQTKTNDIQELCYSHRVSFENSFLFFFQSAKLMPVTGIRT